MYYPIQAIIYTLAIPLIISYSFTPLIKLCDNNPTLIPNANFLQGFPNPKRIDAFSYTSDKNVVIVGLPGAYTPTWSSLQVPGYLNNQGALINLGIDEVIVFSVNDPAVMQAWGKDQKIIGSLITFLADPKAEFTRQLKMEITHPGPESVGIIGRCKRFAIYAEKGKILDIVLSEKISDPSGDKDPSNTLADCLIKRIRNFRTSFD